MKNLPSMPIFCVKIANYFASFLEYGSAHKSIFYVLFK